MITISMLKRNQFGRPTGERVQHSAKEGHSINAFYRRGGYTHTEFEQLHCTVGARILAAMAAAKEPATE